MRGDETGRWRGDGTGWGCWCWLGGKYSCRIVFETASFQSTPPIIHTRLPTRIARSAKQHTLKKTKLVEEKEI